jgi:hypothetical protein
MHGTENIRDSEIIFQMLCGKIQIAVLEDESVTASHIENVFGFTAKNNYVEV